MLSDAQKWNPKKRIKKVVIPYIIWTLIYVIIKKSNNLVDIPVIFVKNLLSGEAETIMYYIFVYCEFTLLIPLIDKLAKSKYRYLGFVITPLEIIFMRTIPLMTGLYEINNSYIAIIQNNSCLAWFTYYYLGYLLGNNLITIPKSPKNWFCLLIASIPLQILEGYWYYSKSNFNCGTQLKLTCIVTSIFCAVLAYLFAYSNKKYTNKFLEFFGDNSFGIYFSHLAISHLLLKIPLYSEYVFFPINTFSIIVTDLFFIFVMKKILGKYSKYLAL